MFLRTFVRREDRWVLAASNRQMGRGLKGASQNGVSGQDYYLY